MHTRVYFKCERCVDMRSFPEYVLCMTGGIYPTSTHGRILFIKVSVWKAPSLRCILCVRGRRYRHTGMFICV